MSKGPQFPKWQQLRMVWILQRDLWSFGIQAKHHTKRCQMWFGWRCQHNYSWWIWHFTWMKYSSRLQKKCRPGTGVKKEVKKELKRNPKRTKKRSEGKAPAVKKAKAASAKSNSNLVEFLQESQSKDHKLFKCLANKEAERDLLSQNLCLML